MSAADKVRTNARKWYYKNRQRALDRIKNKYQQDKDKPDFKAKRKAIRAKSRLKHLDTTLAANRDYYHRTRERWSDWHQMGISFLGKYVHLGFDPRRGTCSQCGYEGFTAIHHIMYDPSHPAAYTIELCVKCHKAEPNGPMIQI